jgi:energy-coupling factor transporter ATP-binding protein EcfA2
MSRKDSQPLALERRLGLRPELEAEVDKIIQWDANWVMHGDNQRSLLDSFFATVRPNASLAFFYAKHSPLSDDPRRLLVGAAEVTNVTPGGSYRTDGSAPFPAELWETVIEHSLRPDQARGFLMPYQALMAARDQRGVEIDKALAFAPESGWVAFSYVSEHVNHDLAIEALLTLASSGRTAEGIVGKPLPPAGFQWIEQQLNRLWGLRGPYPGFGSAASAFGIPYGTTFAHILATAASEREDLWTVLDEAITQPGRFGPVVDEYIPPSTRVKWTALSQKRRALLELLSRFALSTEQATRFFVTEQRTAGVTDDDLLADPYLLAYADRGRLDPVVVATIDRGILPRPEIAMRFPLPEPSRMTDPLDRRRVQALLVSTMDVAAAEGHTLLPQREAVQRVRDLTLSEPCKVEADLLDAYGLSAQQLAHGGPLAGASLADGSPALQLREFAGYRESIRRVVETRSAKPLPGPIPDFATALDTELSGTAQPHGASTTGTDASGELEQRARTEKVAALQSLFSSRISVLVGPAGTGKTTLLKVLCDTQAARDGKVLLLAPTGKARVRLTDKVRGDWTDAATVAQFLRPLGRYNATTGEYRPTGDAASRISGFKTIIVDESSMLTEPELAALLDALTGYQRLILVGDPRQLPPIGAGRPFVDIVARLRPEKVDSRWPKVAAGYAELTVHRRQTGQDRDDLAMASWFADGPLAPTADEAWDRLCRGQAAPTLRAVRYEPARLRDSILSVLKEELDGCAEASEETLSHAFAKTYGGELSAKGYTYFPVNAVNKVDRWQILSPVRGRAWGTTELNRMLKDAFRALALEQAKGPRRYNAPPLGPERIVVGDKVINVRNAMLKQWRLYPQSGDAYVANGELGVVVGQTRSGPVKWAPDKTEVAFAGRDTKYHFSDWKEDRQAPMLELAWAITIHKAQGSEFGLTIIVLPAGGVPVGRELIYTALTRQRDKVVLLHEAPVDEIEKMWSAGRSETAKRLTNLFQDPDPIACGDVVLDRRLVHLTKQGEPVRTADEARIANILDGLGLSYTYRTGFHAGGTTLRPTFEIATDMGDTAYWEHLGDRADPTQIAAWQRRLDWYAVAGVRPHVPGSTDGGLQVVTWATDGSDPAGWEKLAREAFVD